MKVCIIKTIRYNERPAIVMKKDTCVKYNSYAMLPTAVNHFVPFGLNAKVRNSIDKPSGSLINKLSTLNCKLSKSYTRS